MKFILIMILAGRPMTAEFNTQERCHEAARIIAADRFSPPEYWCVRK